LPSEQDISYTLRSVHVDGRWPGQPGSDQGRAVFHVTRETRVAPESLASVPGEATSHELTLLAERYHTVRRWTEQICEPLATEDYVVQSMPDAGPVKWHPSATGVRVYWKQAQCNPSAGRSPAIAIVRTEPPPNPRASGEIHQIDSHVGQCPRYAAFPTGSSARPYQGLTPNRKRGACPKWQSCRKSRLRAPLGESRLWAGLEPRVQGGCPLCQ
jgi:hypothetical protein